MKNPVDPTELNTAIENFRTADSPDTHRPIPVIPEMSKKTREAPGRSSLELAAWQQLSWPASSRLSRRRPSVPDMRPIASGWLRQCASCRQR